MQPEGAAPIGFEPITALRLTRDGLPGGVGVDGERVDAGPQLVRERTVDDAVPLEPRLAREGRRDNSDAEMALPRAGRRRMPGG